MNQNNKIKIVFLLPSIKGGPYWQPILTRYTKIFPKTVLISGNFNGYLKPYESGFKLILTRKPKFIKVSFKVKGHYPVGIFWMPIFELVKLLYKIKPVVVWSANFSVWTFVALIYKKITKAKLIIIFDGVSPSTEKKGSKINIAWRRFISKHIDGIITNTKATKFYLKEKLFVYNKKIFIQPYQVPDKDFLSQNLSIKKISSNKICFITIGQVIQRKGLLELIDAAKLLKESCLNNEWIIKIVGRGDLKNKLLEAIKRDELENNIIISEYVPYEKVGHELFKGDVFLFPTLEDVWGVAPLEAMSLGKPVICSKYAGIKEIVEDGVNGFVVDPLNIEELALTMKKFIENPSLIKKLGKNAEKKIDEFSIDNSVDFFRSVTLKILKNNGRKNDK